jgi:hypothetical protein
VARNASTSGAKARELNNFATRLKPCPQINPNQAVMKLSNPHQPLWNELRKLDTSYCFAHTLSMRFTATYAYYYYATLDTGRVRRRMR